MHIPKTLQEAIEHYRDEQVCIDVIALMRWKEDGPHCPDCRGEQGRNPYYLKTQKRWKCRYCRRQFSVKVGTIFEDSPISLCKWLPALWLICNSKNGVSSWEIHRSLGVCQKTAWFMLHRLRLALRRNDLSNYKMGAGESGVETDETFIGGKLANMHKSRRIQVRALAATGVGLHSMKTVVQGFLDRDLRQVRATVIPGLRRDALQERILKTVKYGSRLYSDDATAYQGISYKYIHEAVGHYAQEYVRGQVHTNGIENFWSLLKRTLKGTYVAVEPFHLQAYIDEQVFRFNNRATKDNPLNDSDRFVAALAQVAGKRLTYKELTGKTAEAAATTPEPF
jgi:transposase-like protein